MYCDSPLADTVSKCAGLYLSTDLLATHMQCALVVDICFSLKLRILSSELFLLLSRRSWPVLKDWRRKPLN